MKKKLTSDFYASVLLLKINFVITLSMNNRRVVQQPLWQSYDAIYLQKEDGRIENWRQFVKIIPSAFCRMEPRNLLGSTSSNPSKCGNVAMYIEDSSLKIAIVIVSLNGIHNRFWSHLGVQDERLLFCRYAKVSFSIVQEEIWIKRCLSVLKWYFFEIIKARVTLRP